MKKAISLLLTLALTVTLLAACGGNGEGEQIIYPIDADPEYLDPQIAAGSGSASIIAACFEGLMTLDESGAPVPAAAESYEVSPDGRVYTFHLRTDLQWRLTSAASGVLGDNAETFDKALTAEDFVFGLRRALRPETNSPGAPFLMAIQNAVAVASGTKDESTLGVKAKDPYTLEITLSRADDGFLYALTLPAAMPCDETYFEATRGRYGLSAEYLIYNGPFFISNWNSGTAITVRKERKTVDDYHSPAAVKPASIYFSINNEQATRDDKLESGTYEVAPLTAAQADAYTDSKKITVNAFDSAVFGLLFNCSDPTLKNAAVRRAIAEAFDSTIIAAATALPQADGVVPAACRFGNESYRSKAAATALPTGSKQDAAEQMQTGMDKLDIKEVDLTVLCDLSLETAVRTVMQQWQSTFGVRFSIGVEALEPDVLQARIDAGDFQLAFGSVAFQGATALAALMRFCSDHRENPAGLQSQKYDTLIENAVTAKTQSDALQALQKAESYLVSQSVFLPVGFAQTYLGFAKGVSGIGANATGDTLFFKDALSK